MSRKVLLILLVVLVGVAGVYWLRMWWSWESDYRTRPWAYSRDAEAKLLVGMWTGSFRDPGGVEKRIEVTIDEPVSAEERERQTRRRHKQSVGSLRRNKQAFDGVATITSQLGREEYSLSGAVEQEDFHRMKFRLAPEDESKRLHPNFTAYEAAQGTWRGDEMGFTLRFRQYNADGSSTSTSSGTVVNGEIVWEEEKDPEAAVVLKRTGSVK